MSNDTNRSKPSGSSAQEQALVRMISRKVLSYSDVVRLMAGITETLSKNIFGQSNDAQGIKLVREKDRVTVNIHIVVRYGANIPQVSYDIQNDVKTLIEKRTKLIVDAVNVGIEGVERTKN